MTVRINDSRDRTNVPARDGRLYGMYLSVASCIGRFKATITCHENVDIDNLPVHEVPGTMYIPWYLSLIHI